MHIHLHLTADTGEHFIRKLMNLLLEKKEVPSLHHIKHSPTFFMECDQVSSVNLTDQMCV